MLAVLLTHVLLILFAAKKTLSCNLNSCNKIWKKHILFIDLKKPKVYQKLMILKESKIKVFDFQVFNLLIHFSNILDTYQA